MGGRSSKPSPENATAAVKGETHAAITGENKNDHTTQLTAPITATTPPAGLGAPDDWSVVIAKLEQLESRLDAAENQLNVNRVRRSLQEKQVLTFTMKKVPTEYYSLSLAERAKILQAASVSQLCKTIVLENTLWEDDGSKALDLSNARYVALVLQYEAKMDTEELASKIHLLRPTDRRISRRKFKFQLAPEAVSDVMTGFIHNAVAPIGLRTPIPLVVCQRCLDVSPPFLFLGGGEVDMKLGISTSDLMRATGAQSLGYVSTARGAAENDE